MLTKSDKQFFENLLEEKLEEKLDKKLDEKLKPILARLSKIEKDLKTITDFLDRELVKLQKRVTKIEEHLGI